MQGWKYVSTGSTRSFLVDDVKQYYKLVDAFYTITGNMKVSVDSSVNT
jgi:hypothetical protein